MTPSDDLQRIRQVYATTYRPDPRDRAYPWHPRNPISVYYRQAQERALIRLFNDFDLPVEQFTVLDVGCGSGGFLRFLASLGASPAKLHGIDLMPYRIEQAQVLCPPGVRLQTASADALPYPNGSFDLVSQFTVFSSIFDAALRAHIAAEMSRILAEGGYLLWYDMRIGNGQTTRGIQPAEIRQLFAGLHLLSLRPLHPRRAASIARRSWLLAELCDQLPGLPKSHHLALFQKKTSP